MLTLDHFRSFDYFPKTLISAMRIDPQIKQTKAFKKVLKSSLRIPIMHHPS